MSAISMTCELFEANLGEFLEPGLDAATRAACDTHVAQCAACAALVAELDDIVLSARQLPLPAASRDLWPAIESRLETSVRPIARVTTAAHPFMTWRRLAVAAVALVSVSAGLTWSIARRAPAVVSETATVATLGGTDTDSAREVIPSDEARTRDIDPPTRMVDGMPPAVMGGAFSDGPRSGLVANGDGASNAARNRTGGLGRAAAGASIVTAANTGRVLALDTLYGREIAMLRTVAETQLGLLDSSTVSVVRRNLDIIDNAIRESRLALANDPNSGFLLDQLDRAYERKVDLLRQLALL